MRVLRDSGQTQRARQEGHEGKTHNKRFHGFVLFIRLVTFTKEQAKRFSTETAKQARKFQRIQDRWAVALEFHQALITKPLKRPPEFEIRPKLYAIAGNQRPDSEIWGGYSVFGVR